MKKIACYIWFVGVLISLGMGFGQTVISSSAELGNAFLTGGVFQLSAGRYELNSALTISRDLSLTGESKETTVIVVTAAPVALSVSEAVRLNFHNLSFEYGGTESGDIINIGAGTFVFSDCSFSGAIFQEPEDEDATWYGDGIYLYGNASGSVSNCSFSNNGLAGIQTDEQSSLELSGSSFSQNRAALGVFGSSSITATHNVFQDHLSSEASIAVYGEASISLNENQFLNNPTNALFVYDAATAEVSKNIFTNNGNSEVDAVFIDDQAVASFTENQFLDNPRIALTVSGDANAVITSNLFQGNGNEDGYAAITLEGNASASLTDNTLSQNTGGALTLLDNAEALLENNSLSANLTWVSIYLEGSSKLNMTGNLIETSEGDALYATDQVELISDADTFLNNTEFAIRLANQAQANISNGIFEGNRSGILLTDDSYASISGNILKNNRLSGVAFFDNAKGIVKSNLIEGHSRNGIAVGGSSAATIEENQLSHNDQGILLAETTTASVKANTLKNNVHGIYVVNGATPEILENSFEGNENDQTQGLEPQYE